MKLEVETPLGGVPKSLDRRIADVRARIADAAHAAGRDPSSIRLLGVAKRQSPEIVAQAIRAGVHDIGESYVQEARAKYEHSSGPMRRHFIGHVQTNKAKAIVELFDVVQSVDRLEAGMALARASKALNKPLSVLLQVNISPTERFGADPQEAEDLAARLRAEGLHVDGVMAIGPLTQDQGRVREAFLSAAEVFGRVGGSILSLGMSGDFTEAIACGSTMVRIGTALFGTRG